MTVAELIAILQTMPQDFPIEVNDNNGGQIYPIEQVDCFTELDDELGDYPVVVIQVNCDFGYEFTPETSAFNDISFEEF